VRTVDEIGVDDDIARARSLPASAFTDPEFLARELETLFSRSWLLLAAPPLAGPGAHAPVSLLGRPLLLRATESGGRRLFPNVCTHAWHTLCQAPGQGPTLTCPQHGRTFDGEGRCLAQRGFTREAVPDFPGAADHLRSLPLGALGPLAFTCLGEPARPFDEWIAPVRASLGALRLDALVRREHPDEVREVSGNWKLHAWNYMDTFHIPYIHRAPGGLADAIDLASYATELHEGCALQWAYARDAAAGFEPELLAPRFRDARRRVFALWWFLAPNLTLNFYPWGLSVNVYEPVPGAPDRTRFVWQHFVLDEEKYARRDERWHLAKVDQEDVAALAQVRLGAASGFAVRGRFAPEAEKGPHWFHRLVAEGVSQPVGAALPS